MTAIRKIFLDVEHFSAFSTTPTNVNTITLLPFSYMATHDGTTLGLQDLSLQGEKKTEVTYATLDTTGNAGKYTVNPTNNTLILLVDKLTVDTEEKAIKYIIGFLLEYQMVNVAYSGTDNYVLKTYAANGTFVGEATGVKMSDINTKVQNYDTNINVNSTPGYYEHVISRVLVAA